MSDLLNSASLVMIPSGYKEDTVYSVVPSDGSGDLTLTRASNGTRVNSAGLVEVCPWNLLQYSEDFSNAYWTKDNITITSNATTNPVNGQNTATAIIATAVNTYHSLTLSSFSGSQPSVISIFVKAGSKSNIEIEFGSGQISFNLSTQTINYQTNATGTIENYGNGWYKISAIVPSCSYIAFIVMPGTGTSEGWTGDGTTTAVYYYGAQLNIGSTAKPYFPTTDRLNVPRLTYQNGGGGCPSLLLEKQSTNIVPYSETFENWTTSFGALSPNAVTANYGTSPDGTQNADRIQLTINASNTVSQIYQFITTTATTYTASVWLKSLSGTPTVAIVDSYQTTGGYKLVTLTNEWVRYTVTFSATSTAIIPQFLLLYGTTSNSADFLAWGFQLEASSYPTSYIPSTSSSATRVADACFKTGISSLIGQTEGVLFAQFNKPVDSLTSLRLSISDGSFSNWVFVGFEGLSLRAYFRASNTVIESQVFSTTSNVNKIAIAYKSGNYAIYHNGTQIATGSTTYSFSATLNEFSFGETPTDLTIYTVAQIAQFELFPTRLTNAELASLTTI
jgi:hypothetical protein